MNIAEKVLQLKKDFDDVYVAGQAAGCGSNLPSGINEIQTGSFTVASDTAEGQFIALTMSETPTNIIVYAENNIQETYTTLFVLYGVDGILSFRDGEHNQILAYHGSNATNDALGFRNMKNGGCKDITKDGFTVRGYTEGQYYFRSATPYHWIAWR